MGSFEDHLRYGVGFYAVAAVLTCVFSAYLFREGVLSARDAAVVFGGAVAGFPFTLAGAGFPDIDHHKAKPHRFFKRWVAVAAAVFAGYVLFVSGVALEAGATATDTVGAAPDATEVEMVAGFGVVAVGAVVAAGVAVVGVTVLKPRHRGITHTLRAGFGVAAGVGLVVGYTAGVVVPPEVAVLAGGVAGVSFFVGFLSHLQCDGLLVGFLPDAMG